MLRRSTADCRPRPALTHPPCACHIIRPVLHHTRLPPSLPSPPCLPGLPATNHDPRAVGPETPRQHVATCRRSDGRISPCQMAHAAGPAHTRPFGPTTGRCGACLCGSVAHTHDHTHTSSSLLQVVSVDIQHQITHTRESALAMGAGRSMQTPAYGWMQGTCAGLRQVPEAATQLTSP